MIKKTFQIDGMHCTSCAMMIDGELEDLEGVTCANTNYAKCECEIEYDEKKINDEHIVFTIKKTGYIARSK